MAVESTLTKRTYQANGDTREWPVPFAYSRAADIRLMYTDADDLETEITSNFRVNVNESGNTSVTFPVAGRPLPFGVKLTVYRATPLTQIVDLAYGGAFMPDVLEKDGFDRLEMQIQETREKADRAITVDISAEKTPRELLDELLAASRAADRAEAAADLAEDVVKGMFLESGVYNTRAAFTLDETAPSGSVVTLPASYYPTRNTLFLSYAGTVCVPGAAGVPGYYQYEEIGDDPDVPSNRIKILFDAEADVVFDMWVVTSALGKNLDQLAALAARAESAADTAFVSAMSAGESESSVAASASAAESGALAAGVSAADAAASETNAGSSATSASTSAASASQSAGIAQAAQESASASAANAATSESNAAQSAQDAAAFASVAETSRESAASSATSASDSAAAAGASKDAVAGWFANGIDANVIATGTIDPDRLPPVTPAAIGALPATGKAVSASVADSVPWTGITGMPAEIGPVASRTVTRLTASLPAGSDFAVPSYIVGHNRLHVSADGAECCPGADPAIHQYREVGASGSVSAVIQFYDALDVNSVISAEVK